MTSRLSAGTRKTTMIVNFPGSPKACAECFTILQPILSHCVDQMRGDVRSVAETHYREVNQQNHQQSQQHNNSVFRVSSPVTSSNHQSPNSDSSKNPPEDTVKIIPPVPSARSVKGPPPAGRDRESKFPMIDVNEAATLILHEMSSLTSSSTELLPIHDPKHLIHRILAVDLKSNVNLPPFPASVKDGYAVLTIDGGNNTRIVLPAPSTAGSLPSSRTSVSSGYCVRISTGAPVPVGADAVVQVEDTELVSASPTGEEREILIKTRPTFGQDIRSVGCDIKKGEIVLKEGTVLGPVELALISSVGFGDVPVIRLPSVGLLSTGDEIIPAGSSASASSGKIWDANKTCIAGLLSSRNIDYTDLGIAKDESDEVYNKLVHAFEEKEIDVLITTGGVSMGERDVLKRILEVGFDAKIHFGRVNIKPGKPMTFITCDWKGSRKAIFALPGNPVSAFVTCYLFVLPALQSLSYSSPKSLKKGTSSRHTNGAHVSLTALHRTMTAVLKTNKVINLDSRPEFSRGILTFGPGLHTPEVELIAGGQASSRLLSVRDANALVMFPQRSSSKTQIFDGEAVSVILID